jgi:2-C-methyl-D-erythritol 4-phosphate cytidylyltransferase
MTRTGTAAAVVLAGGSGTRVGAGRNKVYLPLGGRCVLAWSLATFAGLSEIGVLVLAVRPGDLPLAREMLDRDLPATVSARVEIADGGATRHDSELSALRHLAGRIGTGAVDIVLIHDGARPLVSAALVRSVLAAARADGGAVPGLPHDDLAVVDGGGHLTGPARAGLVSVQTPQGFRAAPLLAAYEAAARVGFSGTDTAACVERFADLPVVGVLGDPRNLKITYAHDLALAEVLRAPGR